MAQAEEALKRLTDFLARLDTLPARAAAPTVDDAARGGARRRSREHIADDLNTAARLGVMFDLVRALNSAIDAGELGAGGRRRRSATTFDEFDRVLGVLSLRRAGRRAAAGAGRGDRAPDRGAPRGAAARATSPKPIASARTSTRAASCSRTPAAVTTVEEEVASVGTGAGGARGVKGKIHERPRYQDAAAGPEGQGASSSATRRSCRRRTRATIRS